MTTALIATAYRIRGPARRWLATHGIIRIRQGRWIAGVCAGLARRWSIPVWVVRGVFAVLVLFPISSALLYATLWLVLPPPSRKISEETTAEQYAPR